MNIFEKVKEEISMIDLINYLGIKTTKNNYIVCPFHKEKTASLKIYEKSYYCFGCQSNGTVIDFIKNYMGLNTLESTEYLAKAFRVSIKKMTIREQYAYEKAKKEQRDNKRFDKWVKKAFDILLDYHRILYHNSFEYNLENELYVEAIHKLPLIQYYLEWLEDEAYEFYKINRKVVEKYARRVDKLIKQER
ncbi:MAG: hypothetical protein K2F59_04645 [Eubacteriales bacterium]|nr:hypothetical protein [Eubacteriales bacterium]